MSLKKMSMSMSKSMKSLDVKFVDENNDDSFHKNIFRYKFSTVFMRLLFEFSKIHQYDDRKTFKESWLKWIEINDDDVNNEIERLRGLGYDHDIVQKMFISSRYYFRNKSTEVNKPKPKERKTYITLRKDLLECMDFYISRNIYNADFKPSTAFVDFCNNNKDVLREELIELTNRGITDTQYIHLKIKKTFKNRHFILSSENEKISSN